MSNALSSMTGFARMDGAHEDWRWTWELKSVNGRGLELRCRLPLGFDSIEPELRKCAKTKLSRGSVNVNLTLHSEKAEARYRVNDGALADAIAMVEQIRVKLECAPSRAETILALRGVMELAEEAENDEARQSLSVALLSSFDKVLDRLVSARQSEGAALLKILRAQFDDVDRLTKDAAKQAAAAPAALQKKIADQLHELLAGAKIPEERLAQEAALLALKADIREELDRLASHVAAGRTLLVENGPAGRQLDFLTQEFNREANTLCSKASDMNLKRVGLELKKVIDQMREQVQNIE